MTVLIKFEGPQASGKTVLSSYLRNNLREAGFRLDEGYAGDEFGVRDPVDRIASMKGWHDTKPTEVDPEQTGDSPIAGWSPLSSEEMETIAALRNGTAKVIPVSEHQIAMKMILKAATVVESPLVETFAPVDPLVAYVERQWDWSLRTFGPGFRTMGVTDHIIKEVGEVQKNPYDLMEWIDIIILGLDGFWRHGGSAIRLMSLLQFKQDKNFARQWPDWRQRSEDQAIEHDRSDEPQAA